MRRHSILLLITPSKENQLRVILRAVFYHPHVIDASELVTPQRSSSSASELANPDGSSLLKLTDAQVVNVSLDNT